METCEITKVCKVCKEDLPIECYPVLRKEYITKGGKAKDLTRPMCRDCYNAHLRDKHGKKKLSKPIQPEIVNNNDFVYFINAIVRKQPAH